MKKAAKKPVVTLRLGSHTPTVRIGKLYEKTTSYPSDYLTDFRRGLPRSK